jgi:hypothetical protein
VLYDQLERPEASHCAYVRAVLAAVLADSTRVLGWAGLARIAIRAGRTGAALAYWAHLRQLDSTYLTITPVDIGFGMYIPFRPTYIVSDQALYRAAVAGQVRRAKPVSVAAVRTEEAGWQAHGGALRAD